MNSNISPFSPFSKSWCCAGYWGVGLLLSAFRNSRRCYFGFGINSFHLTLSKWNQQFPSLVPKLVSLKLFFPLLILSLVPSPSYHDLGMLRKASYGFLFFVFCFFHHCGQNRIQNSTSSVFSQLCLLQNFEPAPNIICPHCLWHYARQLGEDKNSWHLIAKRLKM